MGRESIKQSPESSQSSQESQKEIKESKESLHQIEDIKAFVNRILEYDHDLKQWAFHLTFNKEESKDLVQETYMRAIKNMNTFRDEISLRAWLFTILKYIFINEYRRKQLCPVTYTDDLSIINIKVTLTSTESIINEKEILHLFTKINQDDALTFQWYMEGFKYEEIAGILHIPLGTVKSRIFHARQVLIKLIKHR
jgi:RNA polymerase sigma-70 factor (ECF subfamily)